MHVEESRGRSKGRTAGEAICKGLVAKADDPAPVAANPPTVIKVVMKILTSGAMARPPEGARPADPAKSPGRQTPCGRHCASCGPKKGELELYVFRVPTVDFFMHIEELCWGSLPHLYPSVGRSRVRECGTSGHAAAL